MCYPQISGDTIVSLRRGVALHDVVGSRGGNLEDFLRRVPHVTIVEVLPLGRDVIISGPSPVVDYLKYRWGDKLYVAERT